MFSLSNFVNLMTQNLIGNNNSKSDIAVVSKKSMMARSSISPAGSSSTDSISPGKTPPPAGSPPTTPSPSSSTSSSGSAAKETWSPAWTDGRLDPRTGLPHKLLLDPDGFLMSYIKVDGRLSYYRCKHSSKLACPVKISYNVLTHKIVKWFPRIHTHDNAAAEALIKNIVMEKIEKYAANPMVNPRHVFNEASSDVLHDKRLSGTTSLMPTSVVVKNKLLKKRQTAFQLPPTPKDWTFIIPSDYQVTTDGFPFLICDEALYGGARVIGFSSPTGLAMLTNSTQVFGDGTFELVATTMWAQLWIFMTMEQGVYLPAVWFFLPNKERATYKVMFSAVKKVCPLFDPLVLALDYELATIQALGSVFPDTRVQGCLVHFKRCLRRKHQELGLIPVISRVVQVQTWVRMWWALQLVPLESIMEVTDYIEAATPWEDERSDDDDDESILMADKFDEALSSLNDYMRFTWIGRMVGDKYRKPRYEPSIWSVRESLIAGKEISTNGSESWNSVSKFSTVSKPNFWRLVHVLKQVIYLIVFNFLQCFISYFIGGDRHEDEGCLVEDRRIQEPQPIPLQEEPDEEGSSQNSGFGFRQHLHW